MSNKKPTWPINSIGKTGAGSNAAYLDIIKSNKQQDEFMKEIMGPQSLTPPGEYWPIEMSRNKYGDTTITSKSDYSLENKIAELVQQIFRLCSPQLEACIHTMPQSLRLAIPHSFLEPLRLAQQRILGYELSKDDCRYNGIQIIPNHEMSIVLYHIYWFNPTDQNLKYEIKLPGYKMYHEE